MTAESEQPQTPPETSTEARPRRRGGRRRGGRGRGRKTAAASPAAESAGPDGGETADQPTAPEQPTPESVVQPGEEPRSEDQQRPPAPAPTRPQSQQSLARRQSLREAQRHVLHIIESLQRALEDLERVQALLDQAERERGEDMNELEALRRSLSRLQLRPARPLPTPSSH